MNAAVLASSPKAGVRPHSGLATLAKRFVNALVASRVRTVELELRRHEALIQDLARRQDHSRLFLSQADLLPFKI